MFSLKNPKKTSMFWVFIVFGILLIILSVFLMPVWGATNLPWKNLGMSIINFVIAAIIIYYMATYLFRKLRRGNGVIKTLNIIEFILMGLIALGCVLSQLKIINISGACKIFGLALWCRGSVEVFRAYYHQRDHKTKFPLWYVFVVIIMITFGTYCFVKPFISDVYLLWAFVVLVLLYGAYMIWYGVLAKPKSKK